MSAEMRAMLAVAVLAGALTGLVLALLAPAPVPVIVVRSDPAAYELAALQEEARRIAAEAADDT